jgi:8-oxo-dGTP diphosphatase
VSRAHRLIELARVPEGDLATLAPLTHAVTVVRHAGASLLVFNRRKRHWELPGGHIDPGETPRACAVRELREESGVVCAEASLRFAGATVIATRAGESDAAVEHGALYVADVEARVPFEPNDEIAAVCWWNGVAAIAGLASIDRQLLELVREQPEPPGDGIGQS